MKLFKHILPIIFLTAIFGQYNCWELEMEGCIAEEFCDWSESLEFCINTGGGNGGGDMNCSELDFESCSLIPICQWNEDENTCDAHENNSSCANLGEDDCILLPMCSWNENSNVCENGGFDWGEHGSWDNWNQDGDCSILDEEFCHAIPYCEWSGYNENCVYTAQYYAMYTIENLDIENGTLDIVINSEEPFFNFQLEFSGIEITGFSGGVVESYEFTIEFIDNYIAGYHSGWGDFPSGVHTLFTLEFNLIGETICVYNGHCNGIWSDGNWNTDNGVEASDCVVISETNNDNYYSNLLNGFSYEYYEYIAESGNGVVGFITIENIEGFNHSRDDDFGDDIGLMDHEGFTSYNECPAEEGIVIAGNGKWNGIPLTIPIYGAIDECVEEGEQLPGFNTGNRLIINLWDEATNSEYIMEVGDSDILSWEESFIIIPSIRISHDLNIDGEINVQDVILLINIILTENDYIQSADLNMDEQVDILDVILLVNLILE
ncbi:MAG: hypothetical protein H8E72_01475 [Candidatus Marinimicrobia bacterium]|nr:hypothetical protein [Candidatus Neomarinimicrobiota bacterium]